MRNYVYSVAYRCVDLRFEGNVRFLDILLTCKEFSRHFFSITLPIFLGLVVEEWDTTVNKKNVETRSLSRQGLEHFPYLVMFVILC